MVLNEIIKGSGKKWATLWNSWRYPQRRWRFSFYRTARGGFGERFLLATDCANLFIRHVVMYVMRLLISINGNYSTFRNRKILIAASETEKNWKNRSTDNSQNRKTLCTGQAANYCVKIRQKGEFGSNYPQNGHLDSGRARNECSVPVLNANGRPFRLLCARRSICSSHMSCPGQFNRTMLKTS